MNMSRMTPYPHLLMALTCFIALRLDIAIADESLPPERQHLFAYDNEAGFALIEQNRTVRDGVEIRDVSFVASPADGLRVPAYVVRPTTVQGPNAGILWVHWLGEPATTNRTEFLDEAVALAKYGVVSVLPDAMWSQPHWYSQRNLDEDFATSVRQVIALRRALDLLKAQTDVDAGRIAVVAHDYGAMFAALAVAVHGGVRTSVWITPTASFTDWAFFVRKPASMQDYLAQNRPLQIADYLRATHGVSTLMQFAGQDEYVPADKATEFAAAVNSPKRVCIYPQAHHPMTEPSTIRAARTHWLIRELVLPAATDHSAPEC